MYQCNTKWLSVNFCNKSNWCQVVKVVYLGVWPSITVVLHSDPNSLSSWRGNSVARVTWCRSLIREISRSFADMKAGGLIFSCFAHVQRSIASAHLKGDSFNAILKQLGLDTDLASPTSNINICRFAPWITLISWQRAQSNICARQKRSENDPKSDCNRPDVPEPPRLHHRGEERYAFILIMVITSLLLHFGSRGFSIHLLRWLRALAVRPHGSLHRPHNFVLLLLRMC